MLGATIIDGEVTRFEVWAPDAQQVGLHLLTPVFQQHMLERAERGYFVAHIEGSLDGVDYLYELDGHKRRADPASRFQPRGVAGPSRVFDLQFPWTDHSWGGVPLRQLVFYELHVGTYSGTGDFSNVIADLDRLVDLGVNAIQLMPVAQFPGRRNWGYDGAFPFAVQNSYGGPRALQRLVDAAHSRGLAVGLDFVCNHLGPEGNWLADFGPYFTDRYHTPWGQAFNFDGPESDEVRRFFLSAARQWIEDFHIDVLRLDAIQMIFDNSARPFLRELSMETRAAAERLGRQVHVIGETNQNDVRQITDVNDNGIGLDGLWNDDFHHSLHALLTGERISVYRDHGPLENLAKAYREGFVLSGQYSTHHRRQHGSCSRGIPPERFIVFAQNHDQIGNRLYGERLSQLISFETQKLTAAVVLLAPGVPLLFMGEEYGEMAPFLYFVDHADPRLQRSVREGRQRDFQAFLRPGQPVPDPTDPNTFFRSRIKTSLQREEPHRTLWQFHRELIRLRATTASLACPENQQQEVWTDESGCVLGNRRWCGETETLTLFYFGDQSQTLAVTVPEGKWKRLLDSAELRWSGPGSTMPEWLPATPALPFTPHSAVVYQKVRENR